MQEPNHWTLSVEEGAVLTIKISLTPPLKKMIHTEKQLEDSDWFVFLSFFFLKCETSRKSNTEGINNRV